MPRYGRQRASPRRPCPRRRRGRRVRAGPRSAAFVRRDDRCAAGLLPRRRRAGVSRCRGRLPALPHRAGIVSAQVPVLVRRRVVAAPVRPRADARVRIGASARRAERNRRSLRSRSSTSRPARASRSSGLRRRRRCRHSEGRARSACRSSTTAQRSPPRDRCRPSALRACASRRLSSSSTSSPRNEARGAQRVAEPGGGVWLQPFSPTANRARGGARAPARGRRG